MLHVRGENVSKTITVNVKVPKEIPSHAQQEAQTRAQEAVVLSLWEAGAVSTRQAAEELGLEYTAFLDLLTARGIPVEKGGPNFDAIEELEHKLAARHSS